MKLKNMKKGAEKGKKQTKKQQAKPEVEQKTNVDEEEEQQDDNLIDIKEEIKKESVKPKVTKRVQTNKFEEVEIDTSKIAMQKKEQVKKTLNTWVVNQDEVKDLLKQDFKLQEREHEFESLTNTKLNEELKQKKQKQQEQKKVQTVGQMKLAPLQGADPLENKNTQKLTLGKSSTESAQIGIGSNTTPVLNFTNSNLKSNTTFAPLVQPVQEDEIEKRMRERQEQRAKVVPQVKTIEKGAKWGRKTDTAKQAPKIEFKSSPLTFTNSALNNKTEQQQFKGFQPLQKSKQEQIYERKEQQFKFTSKKEQQERKKKREQQQLKLQQAQTTTVQQPKQTA